MLLLSVQTLVKFQQTQQRNVRMGNLATQITDHSPKPCPQFLQFATHSLELLGMSITADHDRCRLAHSTVRLTQLDASMRGRIGQLVDRLEVQLRVRRVSDVLLGNGCVDIYLSQFSRSNLPTPLSHRNGFLKQRQQFLRNEAVSPFCQRTRVQRRLVLHRLEPAKVPLRVLQSAFQKRLVRLIERVLEVMQPDHQPHGLGRSTKVNQQKQHQTGSNQCSRPTGKADDRG